MLATELYPCLRIRKRLLSIIWVIAAISSALQCHGQSAGKEGISRAGQIMEQITSLYDSGHDNLFNETYPVNPGSKVTYLAGDDTITGTRVAYLWPASGVFSAANMLFRVTGDKKYLRIIEKKILPGLEHYFDTDRSPPGYQSYITAAGKSDRYYDDDIWLGIDFCALYTLTGKKKYLDRAEEIWRFVISGWDENLGGGIYWCEQKKQSKNTCSNAPAAVFAFKLFRASDDSSYFKWGVRIYEWTKSNLQDTSDYLYFDNKSLSGRLDRRKYTYNSGQMMQAAAMLFKLTKNNEYLREARHIASSVIEYFTEEYNAPGGSMLRIFKNTGNWFNAVLLRGYTELYGIDHDERFLKVYRDNLDQLWNHVRDKNHLFSKDWKGAKEDEYKWLLDQAAVVEMMASAGADPSR